MGPRSREITWNDALDLLAEKLRAAREQDPRGLVGSSFGLHSMVRLRAFLAAFGSPNLT